MKQQLETHYLELSYLVSGNNPFSCLVENNLVVVSIKVLSTVFCFDAEFFLDIRILVSSEEHVTNSLSYMIVKSVPEYSKG